MREPLKRSLWGELKSLFRTTSVDKLRDAGVDRVRVIGLDQIARIVEQAVDRVLEERRLELESHERELIVGEAREELDRLTKEVRELSHVRERTLQEVAVSQSHVDELRLELLRSAQDLESARRDALSVTTAGGPEDLNQGVLRVVRGALGDGDPSRVERLTARLVAYFSSYAESGAGAPKAVDPAAQEQIELLERRMAKLKTRLASAEDELRGALEGRELEPGIASIYRQAQGIERSTAQYQKKKGLMDVIFQANLKIQKGAE